MPDQLSSVSRQLFPVVSHIKLKCAESGHKFLQTHSCCAHGMMNNKAQLCTHSECKTTKRVHVWDMVCGGGGGGGGGGGE